MRVSRSLRLSLAVGRHVDLEAREQGPDLRRQDIVLAAMLTIASSLVATVLFLVVKWIGVGLPLGEVMFVRQFIGVVILLCIAWRTQMLSTLSLRRWLSYAPRTICTTLAGLSWYAALTHAPLAVASAIGYTAPIFTILFGMWFLRERVSRLEWVGVAAGFAGVLIMGGRHLDIADASLIGMLLALAASIFDSLSPVFTRAMTRLESTVAITFYFAMTNTVAGAILATAQGWVIPSSREWLGFGLMGLIGPIMALLANASMRYAEVSKLAPLDYSTLMFSVLGGLWVFNEIPEASFWMGLPLMLVPGFLILWTEYRERRRAQAAAEIVQPSSVET